MDCWRASRAGRRAERLNVDSRQGKRRDGTNSAVAAGASRHTARDESCQGVDGQHPRPPTFARRCFLLLDLNDEHREVASPDPRSPSRARRPRGGSAGSGRCGFTEPSGHSGPPSSCAPSAVPSVVTSWRCRLVECQAAGQCSRERRAGVVVFDAEGVGARAGVAGEAAGAQ